jgi:hypothetical protein
MCDIPKDYLDMAVYRYPHPSYLEPTKANFGELLAWLDENVECEDIYDNFWNDNDEVETIYYQVPKNEIIREILRLNYDTEFLAKESHNIPASYNPLAPDKDLDN